MEQGPLHIININPTSIYNDSTRLYLSGTIPWREAAPIIFSCLGATPLPEKPRDPYYSGRPYLEGEVGRVAVNVEEERDGFPDKFFLLVILHTSTVEYTSDEIARLAAPSLLQAGFSVMHQPSSSTYDRSTRCVFTLGADGTLESTVVEYKNLVMYTRNCDTCNKFYEITYGDERWYGLDRKLVLPTKCRACRELHPETGTGLLHSLNCPNSTRTGEYNVAGATLHLSFSKPLEPASEHLYSALKITDTEEHDSTHYAYETYYLGADGEVEVKFSAEEESYDMPDKFFFILSIDAPQTLESPSSDEIVSMVTPSLLRAGFTVHYRPPNAHKNAKFTEFSLDKDGKLNSKKVAEKDIHSLLRECRDCKKKFGLSISEQRWYSNKKMSLPARCKACIQARKSKK